MTEKNDYEYREYEALVAEMEREYEARVAEIKLEQEYFALVAEISAIHPDLTDPCVDAENALPGNKEGSVDFWYSMINSCLDAANFRAIELGVTLPKHLEV